VNQIRQKYTVYVALPHLTNAQARERLAQAGYTSPE
jgi:hypothetical protein